MKIAPILPSIIVSLCCVSFVFATGQAPDRLSYDGKDYMLFSNPLETLYQKDKSKRPKFMSYPNDSSSGNWRGYVAHWEVANDKLYLTAVDSWLCDASIKTDNHCRAITLADIGGEKTEGTKIFVSWFSGELRVPDGKQLLYVHMGYGSVYERDIIFKVDAGNVGKPTILDNTKQPLPSADERALQELEKLRIWESGEEKSASTSVGFGTGVYDPIVAGKGWNKVVRGATREIVESVLGNGEGEERNKMLKDVYLRTYILGDIRKVASRFLISTRQILLRLFSSIIRRRDMNDSKRHRSKPTKRSIGKPHLPMC